MDARKPSSDLQSLLDVAAGGDHEALGRLFEKFRIVLKRRARQQMHRRLQRKLTDSDLVQETFCTAFQKFGDFNGKTARQFRAWLCGIMDHKLREAAKHFELTAKRDVHREVFVSEAKLVQHVLQTWPPPQAEPEQRLEEEDLYESCRQALRSLPLRSRVAIRIHLQCGSMREAGDAMGLTHEAFRALHARAVRELKQAFSTIP